MQVTISDESKAMLRFEEQRWKYAGAKQAAVRETFGLSLTAYYGKLNRLLDQPEALAHAPMVVKRLRRLRDARRDHRTGVSA